MYVHKCMWFTMSGFVALCIGAKWMSIIPIKVFFLVYLFFYFYAIFCNSTIIVDEIKIHGMTDKSIIICKCAFHLNDIAHYTAFNMNIKIIHSNLCSQIIIVVIFFFSFFFWQLICAINWIHYIIWKICKCACLWIMNKLNCRKITEIKLVEVIKKEINI